MNIELIIEALEEYGDICRRFGWRRREQKNKQALEEAKKLKAITKQEV